MTTRMLRTQILLEPEQHRALAELAQAETRSLSDLIRDLLKAQLAQRDHGQHAQRQRQLAKLEQIRLHRQEVLERRGAAANLPDPANLLEQLRDERDAELSTLPGGD